MTDKELQKIKEELNWKYYGDEPHFPENLKMPITEEDDKLFEELDCIEMLNSCLTYGDDPFRLIDKWWYGHGFCVRSYMSDYEDKLGKERVRELYEMQKEEFSKAIILHDVCTDSEGVSYNSVRFRDEI